MKRIRPFIVVLGTMLLSPALASQERWEAWLWQVAQRTQGIPYLYGGDDPRRGIDCSAYVRWVMWHAGFRLPRTSREQFQATAPANHYHPGYLLFFSESRREIDHVAIYIGRGYMVHASGKHGRVVVEPVMRYRDILVAVRAPRLR